MEDSFLPTEELEKMRKEISLLKKQQGLEETDEDKMMESMNNLSFSITSLLKVFKEASKDLKMDTHDAVLVGQKLDKLLDRMDKIEEQNEKIAKGIVAVADMVEELQAGDLPKETTRKPSPPPVSHSPPPMPQRQQQPKQLPSYNLPEQEKKKKGFLNFGP